MVETNTLPAIPPGPAVAELGAACSTLRREIAHQEGLHGHALQLGASVRVLTVYENRVARLTEALLVLRECAAGCLD